MVYSVGFHLEKNSDPESTLYISKMDSYLKNLVAIIKNINFSLRGATYVNNTRDYLKKLTKIIELINEYYINYPKYKIDKSIISKKMFQLADIMHNDKGYVTPEHINLINSLVDDLIIDNVKEKPIYVSKIKLIAPMLKTHWGGLPDSLKLIIYIVVVFFIAYEFITYVALTKGIPQETAFGYAVGGSIAALVPALMIKDYILK
jgi:hypothetical protein